MTDKYVEKTFLYLIALSVLFHLTVFALVVSLNPEKAKPAQEPTMVDLTDLPKFPAAPRVRKPDTKSAAIKPQRSNRETAPKESRRAELTRPSGKSMRAGHAKVPPAQSFLQSQKVPPGNAPRISEEPITRGEGLFKPKSGAVPGPPTLFPSASKMARLEESYRKKYEPKAEDDGTKFLNTEDIQFGSFLRRFENAVYGVWNYPRAAAESGIEGVTAVRIIFNRGGEITQVAILEKSGSRILDDEVTRTLKLIGPIGSLPKGYSGETFNLIAFFQYRIVGMRLM
jgi:periplasmic protein TonB